MEDYFERLSSGKSRLRPLPAAMGTLLRDESSYRVYDAGLNRAVELAQVLAGLQGGLSVPSPDRAYASGPRWRRSRAIACPELQVSPRRHPPTACRAPGRRPAAKAPAPSPSAGNPAPPKKP